MGGSGWVGGWLEQMGIRLTSASTGVGVEVGAELGNRFHSEKNFFDAKAIKY